MTELKSLKESKDHKSIVVKFNDDVTKKRITLKYDGLNKKIQHELDAYVLSEAISIIIRDYKKQGNNDAKLLRLVVSNLENNFIEVADTVVRGSRS